MIVLSEEDLQVSHVARRRLELCIVLADINSHIGDLWQQYLGATTAVALDAYQWKTIEQIIRAITSRNPKYLDIVGTSIRKLLSSPGGVVPRIVLSGETSHDLEETYSATVPFINLNDEERVQLTTEDFVLKEKIDEFNADLLVCLKRAMMNCNC